VCIKFNETTDCDLGLESILFVCLFVFSSA
jgi:hypothetical protein